MIRVHLPRLAIVLALALALASPAFAQQQSQQSPEITALAVSAWVSQVAQENAMLRQRVEALQQELSKAQKPSGSVSGQATPPTEQPK